MDDQETQYNVRVELVHTIMQTADYVSLNMCVEGNASNLVCTCKFNVFTESKNVIIANNVYCGWLCKSYENSLKYTSGLEIAKLMVAFSFTQ